MLITQVSIFLQGSVDHFLERRGNIGINLYRSDRIAVEDGFRDETRTGSLKGQLPRCHLVENDTERKQIRSTVQRSGPYLLGRHISDGSQCYPRAGEMFFGDVRESLRRLRRDLARTVLRKNTFRQAEVENLAVPPQI